MPALDPRRAFALGQKSQEIQTLWISMGYKVQARIVTFTDGNGGGRARSVSELVRPARGIHEESVLGRWPKM
jgi:hypothetical protein